ncbi:MAG TPA: TonB-dependent receptor [Steroidobacteraceae bacterium]|nr:TonB-dependent receptor [Steroidobacteraceae bacterium]
MLAAIPAAYAQQAQPAPQAGSAATGGLEEIVVTAQKRTENLQDVPISIQALDTAKLEQLNITDIDDYVKYLSGVTTVKGLGQGGNGVGTTHMYMRGVVSGQDGNHSGSQPSVGTYLDDQPITTIDGTPDIHIYDIARIEVLEGPQGTLYGASSEAGTIRIITNKPDTSKFSAAYDVGVNSVDHGGIGSVAEGYVNFPLSPIAAVRLVAWDEHDAGYIHNVAGTNATGGELNGVRTFPTSGLSIDNSGETDNQYNPVSTLGGRVAALLKLGDNWTVTPTFLTQSLNANGFFGFDPAVGDLDAVRYGPESNQDSVTQTALTIEGKVSDFDITYSGGWFVRETHTLSDYSDYSYYYDKFFASGCNWVNESGYKYLQANPAAYAACYTGTAYPAGDYTEPQEYVITNGHYTKWSHELRLTTPQDNPLKGIVGLFAERQVHEIWEQYTIPGAGGNPYTQNPQGLAPDLSIPGVNGNTIWLTDQERVDRDQAAFGQATWDIDKNWQMTGGIRFYKYDNSIQGFYGYSANYQDQTGFYPGQNICFAGTGVFHGAPCQDLDSDVSDSGRTYKANLTYKLDPNKLFYFTYSTGYRPGGVNRVFDSAINAVFPPYKADFLTNWEVGWKTTTDDHTLRWNGAVFLENWNNFQFLFLGPNSVTVVQNAASAQIKGLETELEWAASSNLMISGGATYLHAVTTANYCGPSATIPGTTIQSTDCPNQVNTYADGIPAPNGPEAPSGTQLPVAPKFKANLVLRYTWASGGDWESNVQASGMYQTETEPLLRLIDQIALGPIPAYALVDLSAGSERNNFWYKLALTNVADKRAQLTRFVECATTTCGPQPYAIPTQPRTIALTVGQRF